MSLSRPHPSEPADPLPLLGLSTTPLAGVLLALVAVWIGATPKAEHTVSLSIEPGCLGISPPALEHPIHTVAIDADGSLAWDGQRLPDRATLDARLKAVGNVSAEDQAEVHIQPHKLADYRAVISVMAAAQRNFVTRIGLSGEGFSVVPWRGSIDTPYYR